MRSIRIAEWILELSMTRERAESVAGDLHEAQRGAFWFWRTVLATMIASVWSDFLSAPWRLTATVLLLETLFATVLVLVEFAVLEFALRRSVALGAQVNAALNVLVSLMLGRWIARCCRGREIASWLVSVFLGAVGEIIMLQIVSSNIHWSPSAWLEMALLSLLGAISARVRPRLLSSD